MLGNPSNLNVAETLQGPPFVIATARDTYNDSLSCAIQLLAIIFDSQHQPRPHKIQHFEPAKSIALFLQRPSLISAKAQRHLLHPLRLGPISLGTLHWEDKARNFSRLEMATAVPVTDSTMQKSLSHLIDSTNQCVNSGRISESCPRCGGTSFDADATKIWCRGCGQVQ